MSRSTVAKSRAEKGGKSTNAPTPAVTHEIIPGKFNDQDWNCMVERDDGDDFILDLVEEVCENALGQIYQNYLEKQLVPFTVSQAKDALLQIIEWQFLSRDEGESNLETDVAWEQETEPEPAVTDCWAQGSVPRRVITPIAETAIVETDVALEEVLEEDEPEALADASPDTLNKEEQDSECIPPAEEEQAQMETDAPSEQLEDSEDKSNSAKTKKRTKYKPYTGKLKSAGLKRLTESLDDTEMMIMMEEHYASQNTITYSPDPESFNMPNSCHSIIKLQAGRPPANRDITYDDLGNVVKMTKINPSRLPSHRVRTGFHVVDPQVEAAQARLEAMRTGRHIKGGARPKESISRHIHPVPSNAKASGSHNKVNQNFKESMAPPLLETMEVVAGVTVREGERVKRGPKPHAPRSELVASTLQQGLRPVTLRTAVPMLAVRELLERDSPVIRPLQAAPPIPPIQQKHMEMA